MRASDPTRFSPALWLCPPPFFPLSFVYWLVSLTALTPWAAVSVATAGTLGPRGLRSCQPCQALTLGRTAFCLRCSGPQGTSTPRYGNGMGPAESTGLPLSPTSLQPITPLFTSKPLISSVTSHGCCRILLRDPTAAAAPRHMYLLTPRLSYWTSEQGLCRISSYGLRTHAAQIFNTQKTIRTFHFQPTASIFKINQSIDLFFFFFLICFPRC